MLAVSCRFMQNLVESYKILKMYLLNIKDSFRFLQNCTESLKSQVVVSRNYLEIYAESHRPFRNQFLNLSLAKNGKTPDII